MDHPAFVEQAEPEEVFTLVSEENRIAILRALWASDDPLSFSQLREATDISDSGQFNYHLDKLRGQFVTKTDEGYELTAAGSQINGAIEAGSYTTRGEMEPFPMETDCRVCGGERTFTYEDEKARVECVSCETVAEFAVPPSAFVNCDREEIPTVAGAYLRQLIERLNAGFCSRCDGPVETYVTRMDEAAAWSEPAAETETNVEEIRGLPIVEYECHQCGMQPTSGLVFSLLDTPEVVSFYHDHGIDIRNQSLWEHATFSSENEQIQQDEPFRAAADFTAGDDVLTVVVDETLTVVADSVTQTG